MFWYGFFIFLHVTFEGEENQLFYLFLVCFSQLHRFSKDVFEMVLMKPIKLPIDHKKYQEIGSFWVLPKKLICCRTHCKHFLTCFYGNKRFILALWIQIWLICSVRWKRFTVVPYLYWINTLYDKQKPIP